MATITEYDVKLVTKKTILTSDSVYALLRSVYDDYADLQALALGESLSDGGTDKFTQEEIKKWLMFLLEVKRAGLPIHLAWKTLDKICSRPRLRGKFLAWANAHEERQLPSKLLMQNDVDAFQAKMVNKYLKTLLVEDGFKPSLFLHKRKQ